MAPEDVVWACRLSGLSLADLWLRYLEIGGSRSMAELGARLGGDAWPETEERFLAVVADEALLDSGLPPVTPRDIPISPLVRAGHRRDEDDRALRPAPPTCLDTPVLAAQLTVLFEQCARTRASARGVRQYAQSVRRAGPVRGQPSPGRG